MLRALLVKEHLRGSRGEDSLGRDWGLLNWHKLQILKDSRLLLEFRYSLPPMALSPVSRHSSQFDVFLFTGIDPVVLDRTG